MTADISTIASGISVVCVIIVIGAFAYDSARPRSRIAIVLLCFAMLAQGVTRLLNIQSAGVDFVRGLFVGVCVSAVVVSVILSRRST
jgi:hypothetical protein